MVSVCSVLVGCSIHCHSSPPNTKQWPAHALFTSDSQNPWTTWMHDSVWHLGLKCASCVSPICLLRWVEWVTFIHGVSRVCHAYMATDLWLRAVSSCSQYKCCAIHCLTPGNQVNAVLHATHSNPAICPAQVLTVNQTGYYNQLLHVRRTMIDIFILN